MQQYEQLCRQSTSYSSDHLRGSLDKTQIQGNTIAENVARIQSAKEIKYHGNVTVIFRKQLKLRKGTHCTPELTV